jgi:hypothetical protein
MAPKLMDEGAEFILDTVFASDKIFEVLLYKSVNSVGPTITEAATNATFNSYIAAGGSGVDKPGAVVKEVDVNGITSIGIVGSSPQGVATVVFDQLEWLFGSGLTNGGQVLGYYVRQKTTNTVIFTDVLVTPFTPVDGYVLRLDITFRLGGGTITDPVA